MMTFEAFARADPGLMTDEEDAAYDEFLLQVAIGEAETQVATAKAAREAAAEADRRKREAVAAEVEADRRKRKRSQNDMTTTRTENMVTYLRCPRCIQPPNINRPQCPVCAQTKAPMPSCIIW